MLKILPIRRLAYISGMYALTLLTSGCQVTAKEPSTNIDELRGKLTFDIPSDIVKWEIFGTPEYTGGVPGPTDFITLIAEFENVPQSWTDKQSGNVGKVWVAPESPRAWLSAKSKAMFERAKPYTLDLSADRDCQPYVAHVRKSGRPVEGFTCHDNGRVLLYLTLSSPGT